MKVSLEWLADYVDITVEPRELADLLTMSGTNVESVLTMGEGISGVVVGRVVEVTGHPNADNLMLAVVDDGAGTRRIVCGAPNLVAGMKTALALPGARLPALSDRELMPATIRGVESAGMMVSALELGISDDHSGIIELDAGAPVGAPVHDVLPLNDVILELEITPNRPDCMSIVGVAREIAAVTGGTLKPPDTDALRFGEPISGLAKVVIEDPAGCPRYTARVVTGITIGPSPGWMARRLLATGLRPINNVVDITNYVLMEMGQPLHAFDLDILAERTIVVRRARPGESMTTLDGAERPLDRGDLVIADASDPVALAGIMGGEDSEVTERSRNILIESAFFDPTGIMLTSRRMGLRTEASARFERGCDPMGTSAAAMRAAVLMESLAGGVIAEGELDVNPRPYVPVGIVVRPGRVNRVLGTEIKAGEMAHMLRGLEVEVEEGEVIKTVPPSFRPDLEREIDMIEEIARVYGYSEIPSTLPSGAGEGAGLKRDQALRRTVEENLSSQGFSQLYLYSFMRRSDLGLLRLEPEDYRWKFVELVNPVAETGDVMRTTLIPGLFRAAAANYNRGNRDLALFETGRVFLSRGDEELPEEKDSLGVLLFGAFGSQGWSEKPRRSDFFDLKGALEGMAAALSLDLEFDPAGMPFLAPGRSAGVDLGGKRLGYIGQAHPSVIAEFGLEGELYVAEIDLAPLLASAIDVRLYGAVGRFPNVKVDIAVVVDDSIPAREVERVITEAGGDLLESVRLFDVYTGEQVPRDKKSLAYALEFGSAEGTLTDKTAHARMDLIVSTLGERFGATLRGDRTGG